MSATPRSATTPAVEQPPEGDLLSLDLLVRLDRTVRPLARQLTREAASTIVQNYYVMQGARTQFAAQENALGAAQRPTDIIGHLRRSTGTLENQMVAILGEWAAGRPEGEWAMGQWGCGPVLAAGFGAHIDIERAPTVGHIWRYAGMDPTSVWCSRDQAAKLIEEVGPWPTETVRGRSRRVVTPANWSADQGLYWIADEQIQALFVRLAQRIGRRPHLLAHLAIADGQLSYENLAKAAARRPYDLDLKVICWRLGQCFVYLTGERFLTAHEDAYYPRVYLERKAYEIANNEAGRYADQAADALATRNIRNADLKATYESGRLPAGRIDLRARRYAVKLFLAHWHAVAYQAHYGEAPPAPYPIAHMGHTHFKKVPPAGKTSKP